MDTPFLDNRYILLLHQLFVERNKSVSNILSNALDVFRYKQINTRLLHDVYLTCDIDKYLEKINKFGIDMNLLDSGNDNKFYELICIDFLINNYTTQIDYSCSECGQELISDVLKIYKGGKNYIHGSASYGCKVCDKCMMENATTLSETEITTICPACNQNCTFNYKNELLQSIQLQPVNYRCELCNNQFDPSLSNFGTHSTTCNICDTCMQQHVSKNATCPGCHEHIPLFILYKNKMHDKLSTRLIELGISHPLSDTYKEKMSNRFSSIGKHLVDSSSELKQVLHGLLFISFSIFIKCTDYTITEKTVKYPFGQADSLCINWKFLIIVFSYLRYHELFGFTSGVFL